MSANQSPLGPFLKSAREAKRLTLRDVEREVEISNAYLSQLESGRIKEPSPNMLFRLCELYGVSYDLAMELAGYPSASTSKRRGVAEAYGRLGPMTPEEATELSAYLRFLRSRKRKP